MPSSATFIGVGLALQSVTPTNNNTVLRVRFTNDPQASNAASPTDALNVLNWTLTGAGFVGFQFITPVGGDPQSVDLTLTQRLPAGIWTITVANVQTVAGASLGVPTSLTFNVINIINTSVVNPGSTNDSCESILRKHLNPTLVGPGWDAVISGLAAGDCPNFDNNHLAFDQLYTTSASGKYLDRITANDGIVRPKNVGASDEVYRHLAIKITNNKVVNEALLEVLAVYYGEDAVRAHATTQSFEPFALNDGDDLNVTIDGLHKVKIVFNTEDFTLIGVATAVEVAGAITRAFIIAGVSAFAEPFTDPADNKKKVKIYSGSLGLKGTVQIRGSSGGKAQNALMFDSPLNGSNGTGNVYTGEITADYVPVFIPIVLGTPCVLTWTQVKPTRSVKEQGGNGAQFLDGRVLTGLGINNHASYTQSEVYNYQNHYFDLYSADGLTRTSIEAFSLLNNVADVDMGTLGDGRILAVYVDPFGRKTATLDPGTLLWTVHANCPYDVVQARWVTLPSGNILVTGADNDGSKVIEFDQTLNTWSTKAPMIQSRKRHEIVLLNNGKVLVTGGQALSVLSSSEVYDPGMNAWSATVNSMNEGHLWHRMVKMANGRVLIVGGFTGSEDTNRVYHYDEALNVFVHKAPLPWTTGLTFTHLVSLPNNYVAALGGTDASQVADGGISKQVHFYNANTDTWTSGTDMHIGRAAAQCHVLGPCKVMMIGGEVGQFNTLGNIMTTQSVEVCNLGSPSTYYATPSFLGWNFTASMSQARVNLTGIDLLDGKHLVIGGQDLPDEFQPSTFYNNVDSITADGTAVSAKANLPWNASHVNAVLLQDGKVLASGGWITYNTGTSNAAVYDPGLDTWTTTASLPVAVRDHQMAVLPDGKVLMIGGRLNGGNNAWAFYAIYDPGLDTWSSPVALPSTGVYGAGVVQNANGIFTFFGLTDGATGFDKILFYDFNLQAMDEAPVPMAWTTIFRPGIMKLDDNRVSIGGGFSGGQTDFPANPDSWTKTAIFTCFLVSGGNFNGNVQHEYDFVFTGRSDHGVAKMGFSENAFIGYFGGHGDSGIGTVDIIDTILLTTAATNPILKEMPNAPDGPERGFATFQSSDGKTLIVGGYNESNDFVAFQSIFKSIN